MWKIIFIEVDRFNNIVCIKEYNEAPTLLFIESSAVQLAKNLQEKNKIPNRTYYAVEL